MIQIRAGDLVTVQNGAVHIQFAVLTKQILFGGHWCFVFHSPTAEPEAPSTKLNGPGFNAFVDFIAPKREGRVTRVSRGNEVANLMGPEFLQQQPLKGEVNYQIYRWKNGHRSEVEHVRFTASPTPTERAAPEYACIPADFACELASRRWKQGTSMWAA